MPLFIGSNLLHRSRQGSLWLVLIGLISCSGFPQAHGRTVQVQTSTTGIPQSADPNQAPAAQAVQPTNVPVKDRAAELEADLGRMVRRLYLVASEEARPEMLVSLLTDQSTAVVTSALDLVSRELAGGQRQSDKVASAVFALLSHPLPAVRTRAATVTDLLANPLARDPLTAALEVETLPEVAEILLRAAARWPDSLTSEPVLHWVSADRPMTPGLARALYELLLLERYDPAAVRTPMLDSIRRASDSDLTLSMCRLLVRLGSKTDHDRLLKLMLSGEPAARSRAATALAEDRAFRDQVLQAAKLDAFLFDAGAAAAASLPAEDALLVLLSLPSDDTPATLDHIRRAAARLPIATLLRAHNRELSAARRVAMLTPLRDRTVRSDLRGQGLIFLAEAMVEQGQFNRAMETSDLAASMVDSESLWADRAMQAKQRAQLALSPE